MGKHTHLTGVRLRVHTNGHTPGPSKIVAVFDYLDGNERLLYQAVRYEPKDFSLRHTCPDGKLTYSRGGKPEKCLCPQIPLVLYRLPKLLAADPDLPVLIPEGEAHADKLIALGQVATTFVMGAGKSNQTHNVSGLKDRDIVVLPDSDKEGQDHAQKVAAQLQGVARSVRVLPLPDLAGLKVNSKGEDKADVIDWLAAGHTVDELIKLAAECPEWQPPTPTAPTIPAQPKLPDPLRPEAYHGLTGEIVRALALHTEACPASLLITHLEAYGNVVGEGPHAIAEAARHGTNLFSVLVGKSSKSRKGSSWSHIRELYQRVAPVWTDNHIKSGLASGEGLIWEVRDAIEKTEVLKEKGRPTGETVTYQSDPGVSDKRLLVTEPEFASVLQVMGREKNTLSTTLRQAWDSNGVLRTMAKGSPAKATGAHISVLGHITQKELVKCLTDTEAANGFGNRFLWFVAHRAQFLPEGGGIPAYGALVPKLHQAVERARHLGLIVRDDQARAMWAAIYPELSGEKPGLFGDIVSRGEAQVTRLSLLYAAIDGSPCVTLEHLKAALAVWQYAEDSALHIFGHQTGDDVADQIWEALAREGMDRTAINYLFGRHVKSERITAALTLLQSLGRVRREVRDSAGGRPREIWERV